MLFRSPLVEDMEPEAIADDDALMAEEEAQKEVGSVQEAQSETETLADTEAEPDDAAAKEADGIGDHTPIFSSRTKPLRTDLDVPPATRYAPAAPLREVEGEPVFASRGRQEPTPLGKPDGKKTGNMPPLPSALQVASASLDPAEEFEIGRAHV